MITIPTIQQLQTDIISDLEAKYGDSISTVGKVALRVIALVQAAKLKLYYLALANIQKNIAPDTAESESVGGTLERFGRIKLGRNPYPAVAGEYELTVTGTTGGVIAASTTFKSNDNSLNPGIMYVLDNAYTMPGTTGTITVRCLTPGEGGKLNVGNTLTATAPIALVDSIATVASEITEPLAAEDIEAYRLAVLNSYRLEAMGGAATDYRLWAQDAQGVAKVYPYAKSNAPAEINLYVEATVADSIDGKGTPSNALLSDVESVIEFNPDTNLPLLERGRRPLDVIVNYLPITPKNVDITITGYQNLTTPIQAQLETAITDFINTIRPFVAAADVLADKNDTIDTNKIIGVIISSQPGAVFLSITIEVNGSVVPTYTFTNGNIPYVNSITFA